MYFIKACKCQNPFFVPVKKTKICSNITEILCGINSIEYFFKQDPNKICIPSCPIECNTVSYSLSVSHSDFPNPKYAEFLKNKTILHSYNSSNINDDIFKRSIVGITIFYDNLRYTMVNQIPKMNFFDLLAYIGGQFGLFLGISILSFVEIFEAFFKVIFILLEKNDKNLVKPLKH